MTSFTNKFPKVSIITVVYNGEKYIRKTINSVNNISYPRIEHIVIDGGSTDSTIQIINSEIKSNAVIISEPDNGIYDAMNKGLSLATGDFLWFLNAGDTPAQSNVLMKIFASDSAFDYYYGGTCLVTESGQLLKTTMVPTTLSRSLMLSDMQVSHQSFIVRRNISPRYDLNYSFIADLKWIVDILSLTKNGRCVDFPISNYLLGGLSHKKYGWFVLEKIRYSFNELEWFDAFCISAHDVLKAAKFYAVSCLRRGGFL